MEGTPMGGKGDNHTLPDAPTTEQQLLHYPPLAIPPTVYLPTHPRTQPSTRSSPDPAAKTPPTHPPTHPPTYISQPKSTSTRLNKFVAMLIHPPTHPTNHPPTPAQVHQHPSEQVCRHAHPPTHPSTHPPFHPSTHLPHSPSPPARGLTSSSPISRRKRPASTATRAARSKT